MNGSSGRQDASNRIVEASQRVRSEVERATAEKRPASVVLPMVADRLHELGTELSRLTAEHRLVNEIGALLATVAGLHRGVVEEADPESEGE